MTIKLFQGIDGVLYDLKISNEKKQHLRLNI